MINISSDTRCFNFIKIVCEHKYIYEKSLWFSHISAYSEKQSQQTCHEQRDLAVIHCALQDVTQELSKEEEIQSPNTYQSNV